MSMATSNPTLVDPVCLWCFHPWSRHYANDPEPGCKCGCESFRGGCAKCNHQKSKHHIEGIGPSGFCVWGKCDCDGYEPSR